MLDKLSKADFEKCLHQRFLVHVAEQEPLETELVEVSGLVPADDDPERREPFSLIFSGPAEARLRQSIFKVENETLGDLELFMVTVGEDADGALRHEVIFT